MFGLARLTRLVLRVTFAVIIVAASLVAMIATPAQAQWFPVSEPETYQGPFVVDGMYFRVSTRVVLASADSRYVVWGANQYSQDYSEYLGQELLVLDRATGQISAPTRAPGEPGISGPAPLFFGISADASTIAFVGSRHGESPYLLNVWRRGEGIVASIDGTGGGQPVLSSDGRRLAISNHVYELNSGGATEITLNSLDGVEELTGISGDGRFVSGELATPQARHAVYIDTRTDSRVILDVNLDGSENLESAGHPIISRDGTTVVFSASARALIALGDRPDGVDIFVYSVASGTLRRVEPGCFYDGQWISVSGDGQYIGFGHAGCVVDLSDMTRTQVGGVNNSITDSAVVWAAQDGYPDGGSIFVRERNPLPVIDGLAIATNRMKLGQTTMWSATAQGGLGTIQAAEYYLGSDPGVGSATPVTLEGGSLSGALNATQAGTFELGVRVKDSTGTWGETARATFVVYDPALVSVVTWSGRLLTSDDVPVSGVDVWACRSMQGYPTGCPAVSRTDPDGKFSLTVEKDTSEYGHDYRLKLERVTGVPARAGAMLLPTFNLDGEAPVSLTADTAQDLKLPAMAQVTVRLQQPGGAPVSGTEVRVFNTDAGDNVEEGSFEGRLEEIYWNPTGEGDGSSTTLTDAQGEATFYSFMSSMQRTIVQAQFPIGDNKTLTVYRSPGDITTNTTITIYPPATTTGEPDTDGVPTAVEDAVPALTEGGTVGDGNGDKIPDSKQAEVTSLLAFGSADKWVTIVSQEGTELTGVSSVDTSGMDPPAGMTMLEGLTNFSVTKVPSDALDQTLTIFTASTAGVVGYAKYDSETGWSMLPADRVEIVDEHQVKITLTDGGVGDADGDANGTIVDPGGLAYDRVEPDLTISGIEDGKTYLLGAVPTATCAASDEQSGLAEDCIGSLTGGNGSEVGDFTYTATATDKAGNTSTTTVMFHVRYRVDGFESPINDPNITPGITRSVFKAGSTVPVKIQLKNADGTAASPGSAPVWITPQKGTSTSAAANEDVWSDPQTEGTAFEKASNTWHFNWSTKGFAAGYTYRIGVKLEDGTTHTVVIALK